MPCFCLSWSTRVCVHVYTERVWHTVEVFDFFSEAHNISEELYASLYASSKN